MNSATIDPLGASIRLHEKVVDVNLHEVFYFLLPSRRFSILILCQVDSMNKMELVNYITSPQIESNR